MSDDEVEFELDAETADLPADEPEEVPADELDQFEADNPPGPTEGTEGLE